MQINTVNITPDKLLVALEELWPTRLAAFVWGAPGLGKSTVIKALAKNHNLKLIDLRLTQIDSTDLRGLPYLNEETKRTITYLPEFLPIEGESEAEGYAGTLIFLDELTSAEPRLQSAAYQLVLDRSVGTEYVLPDSAWVVAAGNRLEDGAISYDMGSALRDRFVHFQVIVDPEQWLTWARNNEIASEVLTFIKTKPTFLEAGFGKVTTGAAGSDEAAITPSPRSWERVSNIIKAGVSKTSLHYIIPGIVGSATAIEFFNVLDELGDLPPMDKLFEADDEELKNLLPSSLSGLYGLTYSIADYCNNAEKFIKAIHIFNVLVEIKDNKPRSEIQALAAQLVLGRMNEKYSKFNQQVIKSQAFKTLRKNSSAYTNLSLT